MRFLGYECSKIASQGEFLLSRSVNLVLDVGANRGQYAQEIRKQGYKGRIHSFEPVSEMFRKLADLASKDAAWEVSHTAIGSAPGVVDINVTQNSVYSSIRRQSTMIADFSKKSAIVRTERVAVKPLDHLALSATDIVFLKIDTQGFEQEVLKGASNVLTQCVGVQLELPVEHLYDGVWSFSEAIHYMDELGFVPAQFRMVNPIHDDPVSGIEFDCIFRRKRPSPSDH